MITFDAATEYLSRLMDYEKHPATTTAARYLNLDRMREALARLGDPHRQLRYAHIAGTKGKGSTAAMTAHILQAAGRRVGLFTSPHLVSYRERMRINGEMIGEEELARLVEELQPVVDAMRESEHGPPTYFEATTLLAVRWFLEHQVDVVVLETGMGGRLDSTNVVTPLVTAITTIALDHMTELGDTLARIAGEKAGIIKPGVPVISAPQHPDAAAVIAQVAQEQGSPLYRVGQEIIIHPSAFSSPTGQRFTIQGRLGAYVDLTCPLLGDHQQINAAVAVGMAEVLQHAGEPIGAQSIRAGIAGVKWAGRMQVLQEHPLLMVDGAHDPASVAALLAALDRHFPGRRRRFVLGFLREKDWRQMLAQFAACGDEVILTAATTPRAVPPAELAVDAQALGMRYAVAPDAVAAVQTALEQAHPTDLICISGSLYLVGDTLKWWQATGAGAGLR